MKPRRPALFRLCPLLLAAAVSTLSAAPTTRELTPAERRELDAALADGAALVLDPASAHVFAQRAGAGWSYSGWVDSRADTAGGLCRIERYGLSRAAGATRWRLDPTAAHYWSVGSNCTGDLVHLLTRSEPWSEHNDLISEALFRRLAPRAPQLLRDASLVIRGNTLCARETMAGMQLYEIGAQVDEHGRGEALLAYAPSISSDPRRSGRWSLALRFRVTPDDVTPLSASCEDLHARGLH